MILPERRPLILGLAAALSAAAWCLPAPRAPAGAHDPPRPCNCGGSPQARPLNDMPLGCLANMLGGGIFSVAITATDATVSWQYQFTCPQAQVNLCSTCWQVLFEYWSTPIPGEPSFWAIAPGGSPPPVMANGDCNWTWTQTNYSTYTYPAPPWSATQYRATVWAGPWDPRVGADCTGQLAGTPALDTATFTTLGSPGCAEAEPSPPERSET
jgi:hypothetical protein